MRLINARTLKFEEFYGHYIPKYAILSHTWDEGEVTFQDWQDLAAASRRAGYLKINGACRQALRDGLDYVWVDTNCIDKASSAELTEAINSMFAWYRDSAVCYVYLIDVPPAIMEDTYKDLLVYLRKSRWFTRGWTLQELLAPRQVVFFAKNWARIGERTSQFASYIADITGIEALYMTGDLPLASASIAQKMYWLSGRITTRIEDIAYCMLGIFDINMPLLYGEGSKAFVRLQEEIIKTSNDHTIFCWTWIDSVPRDWVSLLAPSPDTFKYSRSFVQSTSIAGTVSVYSITNAGLSIRLPIIQSWSNYFVVFNTRHVSHELHRKACIPVSGFLDNVESGNNRLMQRAPFPAEVLLLPQQWAITEQDILVRSRSSPLHRISIAPEDPFKYGILILVASARDLLDKRLSSASQFNSGQGLFFVEKTKALIGIETYPQGLFDSDRSMFLFNCKLRDSVYGGFLRLGLHSTGIVVFFAIKISPGSGPLWFCQALPASSWEWDKSRRKTLLAYLAAQVLLRTDNQLFHSSKEAAASVEITEGIEYSCRVFRVAYLCFGDVRDGYGLYCPKEVDYTESDSDNDSVVPAVAHWKLSAPRDKSPHPFQV
jgi:hypothetical protein